MLWWASVTSLEVHDPSEPIPVSISCPAVSRSICTSHRAYGPEGLTSVRAWGSVNRNLEAVGVFVLAQNRDASRLGAPFYGIRYPEPERKLTDEDRKVLPGSPRSPGQSDLLHHSVQVPAVGDALQLVLAGVFERETGPNDQVLHG
jgi:hypothetical protein